MEINAGGVIPVEAVLKLIVDRQGSEQVEQALKNQEESFSRVEASVGRIGTQLEGVGRTVGNLIGVGGIGGLLDKFLKVETSASNVALAMGKVTGGLGAYHGVGQELLGVQSHTGVSVGEQQAALRAVAMSVGLNPKPGQAGMLAEVIAGYGRVTGINPSVLGSILGPMLQSTGRGSSPYAAAYTMGEARSNLSAFPGSQIEAILPGLGQLGQSVAFGAAASGHFVKFGSLAA
jgi:hypothetical protein